MYFFLEKVFLNTKYATGINFCISNGNQGINYFLQLHKISRMGRNMYQLFAKKSYSIQQHLETWKSWIFWQSTWYCFTVSPLSADSKRAPFWVEIQVQDAVKVEFGNDYPRLSCYYLEVHTSRCYEVHHTSILIDTLHLNNFHTTSLIKIASNNTVKL